jgi:hypothetical protein
MSTTQQATPLTQL